MSNLRVVMIVSLVLALTGCAVSKCFVSQQTVLTVIQK